MVNVACLVLRRDGRDSMFRSPGITPVIAALACLFLVGPWVDRDAIVYQIAAGLLAIGVVLWALTWLTNRGIRVEEDRVPRHRPSRRAEADAPDSRVTVPPAYP